jgi:ubiquinol-cytochrome c reductase cytochrome c1 subunit
MKLVAFRTLEDLGYSEAQVKAFAAEYEVQDGPNATMARCSPARPCRRTISRRPSPNDEAAAAANGGAAPPDFSLIAKARGVERGFPQFVIDIFIPYQEGGPDYIHSLLTGYVDAAGRNRGRRGNALQPAFHAGIALAMAQPISDDQVTYDDGSPQTVDQYARDVPPS